MSKRGLSGVLIVLLGLPVASACASQGAMGSKSEPDASYVYFASDVDQPLDGQEETISAAAKALDADPWLRAVVVGHTDSDGNEAYNRDLAFRRAEAVRGRLEELSELEVTERTRLAYYGEERPLADNETDEGKAKNRRVQIYFFHPQKSEGDEEHLRRVFGAQLEFSAKGSVSVGSGK